MTRLEMETRILRSLNDPDAVFHTREDVQQYLVEAMEVFAEEIPALKRTFTVPRRAGCGVYYLRGIGPNIMAPYRIWLPDLHRELEWKSLTDLDGQHETWLTVQGDPWWVVPIGWDKFLTWPITGNGGGTMVVDCYVWPEPLPDDARSPEWQPATHEALTAYGEHLGYLKEGQTERAVDLFGAWTARWRMAKAGEGIKQMQSRLWGRGRERDVDR